MKHGVTERKQVEESLKDSPVRLVDERKRAEKLLSNQNHQCETAATRVTASPQIGTGG